MANKSKSTQQQRSKSTTAKSQPQHGKKKPVRKERGFWLSLVLALMALHGIVAAFFYTSAKAGADPEARVWILTMMVAHSVLNIGAAAGIWFWKKWALYVYGFSTILALIAGLLTGYGMMSSFYVILPVAIVGWLLRTKWDYFE